MKIIVFRNFPSDMVHITQKMQSCTTLPLICGKCFQENHIIRPFYSTNKMIKSFPSNKKLDHLCNIVCHFKMHLCATF
jgi:hypothetical protein